MPLDKSGSKASVGKNIAAEERAGKPHDQAVAIALNTARKAGADIAPPPGEGPMHKSREAHATAAKSLKKNMKKYKENCPPEMEDQGYENPGVAAQEAKTVKKAEATVGKKKG